MRNTVEEAKDMVEVSGCRRYHDVDDLWMFVGEVETITMC